VLSQAEVRESFPGLRHDLLKIGYAAYVLDLTDATTEERQPNLELFDLLLSALYVIERSDSPDLGARMFELRGWRLLGYEPQLSRCVRDRAELWGEGMAFSPSRGGALCRRCAPGTPGALPLSPGALTLMRQLMVTEPPAIPRLPATEEHRTEIARHLIAFTRAHVEAPFPSLAFIEEMKAATGAGTPS
jgi:DNA repair protein RecO (recombination protein O)